VEVGELGPLDGFLVSLALKAALAVATTAARNASGYLVEVIGPRCAAMPNVS
jgi:hypothetical protein